MSSFVKMDMMWIHRLAVKISELIWELNAMIPQTMFLQLNVTVLHIILKRMRETETGFVSRYWKIWDGNFIVYGQQIGLKIRL